MPDLDHQWTWARYKGTNQFKPAEILVKFAYENKPDSYNVKFEDGSEETLTEANMWDAFPKYTIGSHLVRRAVASTWGSVLMKKFDYTLDVIKQIPDYDFIYTVKRIWVRTKDLVSRPLYFMYNMERRDWAVGKHETYKTQ